MNDRADAELSSEFILQIVSDLAMGETLSGAGGDVVMPILN